MTIANIKISIQRRKIERDLPWRVSSIYNGNNARFPRQLAYSLNRKNERGGRGDMADKEHLCAGRYSAPQMFNHRLFALNRQRDRSFNIVDSALPAHKAPGAFGSTILMIGSQHLIPWL